ncbi:NADH:ubiquinone oxidoreductase, 17.2kDa subunit [Trifolium repens]|nr:NADH:ubiquinone oxidoreductase, 17.2kDa subunit [Trifolium repens]
MRRVIGKIAGLFSNRTVAGVDKVGNKYFTKNEQIDGIMKEKRWVVFKGEHDPTSIPVEWICWLNGQRKRAPTPEEQMELEARREQVRQNVALLKKEEEERKAKEGSRVRRVVNTGIVSGPDLNSFMRQFPIPSEGNGVEESSGTKDDLRNSQDNTDKNAKDELDSSEPTGSGASYRPGTWQPPT